MPIQELAPVTLTEIERLLAAFESQYKITSADFLNIIETNVPDDDAAEWNYLLLQREALKARARINVVPTIMAAVRVRRISYGFTRLAKSSRTLAGEPQYDCAA